MPPESSLISWSGEACAIASSRASGLNNLRSRERMSIPNGPSWSSATSVLFDITLSSRKTDSARSPLWNEMPFLSAAPGVLIEGDAAAPAISTSPLPRRSPTIVRTSSRWPLPSEPAMPTISPLRTARETGPKPSPRNRSARNAAGSSRGSPVGRFGGNTRSVGAPTISVTISSTSSRFASS